jgi:AraC-like DNA-binding protein
MKASLNTPHIKRTAFNNERLIALGIEPIGLGDLRAKLEKGVERLEFYMLLLVTEGEGRHKVDFIEYKLKPGSFVFVRPGQIQEWDDFLMLEGEVVLIDPQSLPHDDLLPSTENELLTFIGWQNLVQLPTGLYNDALDALLRLRRDFSRFDGSSLDIALIRHELLSLLLRLARWQGKLSATVSVAGRSQQTYQLFIRLLERKYATQHSLNFYAQRLGYAQSTLSRACLQFEGVSAKVVIDRRIVLEAQRILVHSQASVAEVGFYLGFSETTNFIKFFRRLIGVTPLVFRERRSPSKEGLKSIS